MFYIILKNGYLTGDYVIDIPPKENVEYIELEELPEIFNNDIDKIRCYKYAEGEIGINFVLNEEKYNKILLEKEEYNKKIETQKEILMLKERLASSESEIGDWKIAKIQEYQLLGLQVPYSVEELHKKRQEVRNKINELEICMQINNGKG